MVGIHGAMYFEMLLHVWRMLLNRTLRPDHFDSSLLIYRGTGAAIPF
jgi:hypothetical protein